MLCGHLLLAVVFAVTNCGSMMGEEPRKTFVLASDSSINPQSDILREAAVSEVARYSFIARFRSVEIPRLLFYGLARLVCHCTEVGRMPHPPDRCSPLDLQDREACGAVRSL
jgi:hypothetical protein